MLLWLIKKIYLEVTTTKSAVSYLATQIPLTATSKYRKYIPKLTYSTKQAPKTTLPIKQSTATTTLPKVVPVATVSSLPPRVIATTLAPTAYKSTTPTTIYKSTTITPSYKPTRVPTYKVNIFQLIIKISML